MPDQNAAEQLHAAAAQIRSAINSIPPNDWDDRPWHVEACSTVELGECPCIVAQGERKPWDEAQVPLMQYIADAETPEYASWIALMHTGVGAALADWLEHTAEFLDDVRLLHGDFTKTALHNARLALAAARQILGAS